MPIFLQRLGSAFPVVLLCLSFLILVLIAGGVRQYQVFEEKFHEDIRLSIDDYAAKVELTAQAVIKINDLFSASNGRFLIEAKQPLSTQRTQEIKKQMEKVFFNFNGYYLLDQAGEIYQSNAAVLDINENSQIEKAVQSSLGKESIFAYHFGKEGAFYIVTPWTYKNESGHFVIRRPFAVFSKVISQGKFSGFEMALLNIDND